MSAEASNSMGEGWASLEGGVVNGAFPLHRYLGGSGHSGVFLTESTKRAPSELALKLIAVDAVFTVSQLSRWLTAADLAHPHLLKVFEAGQCQLDGNTYLYALMEYADQNLAELLERRALTEDEAREMLTPTLSALSFLHEKGFVQGRLKPSNVLVVGDQLKLASDTAMRIAEFSGDRDELSPYDPPEAREGACSPASDVWALGFTLCEALTRRQPTGVPGRVGGLALPPDVPPAFRQTIAKCLSRNPHDRAKIHEIEAWLRGERPWRTAPSSSRRATNASSGPAAASGDAAAGTPATAHAVAPAPGYVRTIALALGVVAALGLTWAGVRVLTAERESTRSAAEVARVSDSQPSTAASVPEGSDAVLAVANVPASGSNQSPGSSEAIPASDASLPGEESVEAEEEGASVVAVREVLPEVPQRALQTIRGTIRVSVRVIVDREGAVFAALTDNPGPSRYFERLALDAAKGWMFAPAESEDRRLMQLRFNFTRAGTTARAVPLQ